MIVEEFPDKDYQEVVDAMWSEDRSPLLNPEPGTLTEPVWANMLAWGDWDGMSPGRLQSPPHPAPPSPFLGRGEGSIALSLGHVRL